MAISTKSLVNARGIKLGIVGQLNHLPVSFGEAGCALASTACAISSSDDGWKINDEQGINCSSEGPGEYSCKNSASGTL